MNFLNVFFGHASNAEARVYAQWQPDGSTEAVDSPEAVDLAEFSIAGTIVGPHSKHAHTLSATIPFRYHASGNMPLAEAVVPDPCFWTPEYPYTYKVNIEVLQHGEVIHHEERLLGIRPLGARGKSFYLDSRRWVLRGGFSNAMQAKELADWRDAELAPVVSYSEDAEYLAAASELGVLLVGHLVGESEETLPRLERLGHWPAVGMVLIDTPIDEAALLAQWPHNLLLGQRLRVDETMQEFQPAAWADFVVGDVMDPALFAAQTKAVELPVIACRQIGSERNVGAVRTACERLQQDLAPYGDFAGYLV
jgi:hypothetical protein